MKRPLDRTPYPRHPDSRPIGVDLADGLYVYVQDGAGTVHVLPDGPHRHPHVLGHALPARYAGDLTIENGRIKDLTNLSGTFQFDDPKGLLEVTEALEKAGFTIEPGAVRLFPIDGSPPYVIK